MYIFILIIDFEHEAILMDTHIVDSYNIIMQFNHIRKM